MMDEKVNVYDLLKNSTYEYDCVKNKDEELIIKNIICEYLNEDNEIIIDKIREQLPHIDRNDIEAIVVSEYTYVSNCYHYSLIQQDDEIQYVLWIGVSEENGGCHTHQNNMITSIGTRFPNGCLYPGDRDADKSEWYNCKCSLIGVIPEKNEKPPTDKKWWYPDDFKKSE